MADLNGGNFQGEPGSSGEVKHLRRPRPQLGEVAGVDDVDAVRLLEMFRQMEDEQQLEFFEEIISSIDLPSRVATKLRAALQT